MAVANTLTWDLSTPRRAGIDDLRTGTKVNEPGSPPTADMPAAEEFNQDGAQLAALNKVSPSLIVSVTYSAGAPIIASFTSPGSKLVMGDFTLTDNGAGDTTIAWPANKIPDPIVSPCVSVNGSTPGGASVQAPTTTSVRVRTISTPNGGANVAADMPFTVTVY